MDEETEAQKGPRSTNKCPRLLKAHLLNYRIISESTVVLVLSDQN